MSKWYIQASHCVEVAWKHRSMRKHTKHPNNIACGWPFRRQTITPELSSLYMIFDVVAGLPKCKTCFFLSRGFFGRNRRCQRAEKYRLSNSESGEGDSMPRYKHFSKERTIKINLQINNRVIALILYYDDFLVPNLRKTRRRVYIQILFARFFSSKIA